MTPTPLREVRSHIERVQATIADPAERDRALGVVERELTDMLGVVSTYRNDSRLQQQTDGNSGASQPTE